LIYDENINQKVRATFAGNVHAHGDVGLRRGADFV
jgi:hypothetical protein